MSIEVQVPALGESVTEATVGSWRKQAGDAVQDGEILCELETDKVNLEVPSPAAGVLEAVLAEEGSTVGPGSLLATLAEGAAAQTGPVAAAGPAPASSPAPAQPVSAAPPPSPPPAPMPPAPLPSVPPTGASAAAGISPAARKILAEKGVSPASVAGTGRDGRITKADALAASASPAATPLPAAGPAPPIASAPAAAPVKPPAFAEGERRERMTRLRQTIARRLKQAQETAAILTTFNDVDMSRVMDLRGQLRDAYEERYGTRLGFMGFFVKACVRALQEIPAVNARIEETDIVYPDGCHIGVAVGTESGLVVPVVRYAERLSLPEIESAIAELGNRARSGALEMADLAGGTFTITNGGVYGSLLSTPILNPPQSAILGMHRIEQRPVVIDGNIVARPMMYLALSYDHRIIDGKEAVTFLVRVKEALESPGLLLLDL